jgi:hypothetical protein
MTEPSDAVDHWEADLERLLSESGFSFEREDPGYSADPRWYLKFGSYVVMVTLNRARENTARAALSLCLQSFILDPGDTLADLFGLLSQCAHLEGVGLIGAEGEDGTRLLLLQRRIGLENLEGSDVMPLVEDLIRQYEQVLAEPKTQRIDG